MSQTATSAREITWNIFRRKIRSSVQRFIVHVTVNVIMKAKFVPVHTVEVFRGSGSKTPLILSLDTKWR